MNKTILGLVIDLRHSRITLSDSFPKSQQISDIEQQLHHPCLTLSIISNQHRKNFCKLFLVEIEDL